MRDLVPTRTVVFRKFSDKSEMEAFRANNLRLDSVAETYPSEDFTAVFAIFFDLREAIKVVEKYRDDPKVTASHTISKYELPKRGDNCKDKNKQSSINILLKNVNGVGDNDIEEMAAEYGEIRDIRNPKPLQRTIEYYDRRDAAKAYDALSNKFYMGGIVRCRWVWDLAFVVRNEYLDRTKEIPLDGYKDDDSEATSKRYKTNDFKQENIFLRIFDECIVENLTEIEKLIRKN